MQRTETGDQIFSGESTFEDEWTDVLDEYNRLYTEGLVSSDVVALVGWDPSTNTSYVPQATQLFVDAL